METFVALSVGIPSISWTIVRLKAVLVAQQITQQALKDCPPAQRAARGVIEARSDMRSNWSVQRDELIPNLTVSSPNLANEFADLFEQIYLTTVEQPGRARPCYGPAGESSSDP